MSKQAIINELKERVREIENPALFFEKKKFLNESDLRRAARESVEARPGNKSFARAAKKAVEMLERSSFWSFDAGRLRIVSPQSGEEYRGITADRCACHSFLSNHGYCWHRAGAAVLQKLQEKEQPMIYYFFNKKNYRIEEFGESELVFTPDGKVFRADGEPIEQIEFAYREFVRASRFDAERDAREFLLMAIDYYADSPDAEQRQRAKSALERVEQETSPLIKPPTERRTERIGSLRI